MASPKLPPWNELLELPFLRPPYAGTTYREAFKRAAKELEDSFEIEALRPRAAALLQTLHGFEGSSIDRRHFTEFWETRLVPFIYKLREIRGEKAWTN